MTPEPPARAAASGRDTPKSRQKGAEQTEFLSDDHITKGYRRCPVSGRLCFIVSMSGNGNCYDNAMVETVFKTLKAELVWRTAFKTRIAAETAIGRYIDAFYNPTRRHSALGFKSPIQFESLSSWRHSQPIALHFFRASPTSAFFEMDNNGLLFFIG